MPVPAGDTQTNDAGLRSQIRPHDMVSIAGPRILTVVAAVFPFGRAHLRSIFAKTGIKRQAELVKVLLNSIVSLGLGTIAPLEQRPPVIMQPEQRFTQDD